MSAKPARHLYLVDGSAYIFRAFHALPPMTRPDGTPVNAVYGFTQMLLKLMEDALADQDVDYLAVIFDTSRVSFRNAIYKDYKAHRPEPPDELKPQFALVREATRALGAPAIEQDGFEADDIIATYARRAAADGMRVTIVSSDKDLMQLVGPGIGMYDPMKNRAIGPDEVREKFGVGPDKVVDVQALAGDSTDNVPGVPGIGVKTAAELIGAYGDLETLLKRAGEIKQPKRRESLLANAELARVSKRLVTLKDDVKLPRPIADLALKPPDRAVLVPFLRANNFRSLLAKMGEAAGPAAIGSPAASEPAPASAAAKTAKPAKPGAAPAPIDRARYETVQDEKALAAWIARATAAGIVAFDTETTSLDAVSAELVGFSLALGPGEACYVPVGHRAAGQGDLGLEGGGAKRAGGPPRQIPRARAVSLLKPLLEDPAVLKIGHNIKYDAVVMRGLGVSIAPVDDTMLVSFVLDAGRGGHGMDELSARHLGHTTIAYEDVTGSGKAQVSFAEVPLDKATAYAAEDAEVTWRLHRALKPRLVEDGLATVYETLERPLVPVVAEMERAGIAVDPGALKRLSADFAKRMAELETAVHAAAGEAFNVGSPKQLGDILFEKLKLPGGKKGKTGAYGTGAEVLEDLKAAHPLPGLVLDWRQVQKLKSTYADALVEEINAATGRIHTSFSLVGAQTGRLASTDPNLQNIPVRTEEGRKIRRAFVAAPGHVLLSLDYSQIELRLLAHVADMEVLQKAFKDGLDIHALTASEVFGVPIKGMDPLVRRKAKAINFGIIYGISAFGLANQLGIEKSEAGAYIEAYFQRYPGIRDYMERTKAFARAHGYVATPFGRRIHLAGIASKNPAERGFAERQSINAPLQGGAADVIKRAMIRIPAALARHRLKARMLLQVHDELLFEVPETEADETVAVLKPVMEKAPLPAVALTVPLVVEAGRGRTWDEAH
jgi:DNA polymerase I